VTFLFGGVKHLNIFCASMQRYRIIVYSGDLIPFQMKMHPSFLHSTLFAYIEQRMCTIHFVTKYVPVYLYEHTVVSLQITLHLAFSCDERRNNLTIFK
jgi:hypothetical protein